MTAAEKYAELEALGQERPKCECHGETMRWAKDAQCLAGGYWACRIKTRESDALWGERNPEKKSEYYVRWYEALGGPEYARYLLRNRRNKALSRMKKRHQTEERANG